MEYSYVRIDTETGTIVVEAPPSDSAVIGTWAWDANELYLYTFNADGTGTRGLPDEVETFTWSVPESGRVDMRVGTMTERWDYVVEDNVFTLTSRQIAGMEFSYIRVD